SHKVDSLLGVTQGAGQHTIQNNSTSNGDSKTVISSIDVQLNNVTAIVLNDAVPNPFAEQTVISYNIPQNFSAAQILFYDNNGLLIKSVDIKTAGKGQLNVFANDLTNGVYSYTLVVDGKIIATKRMIRQQ
ncbi:MAG TPA: T9SS type A sorting domain-containing protein, partial [Bacteroidia bacterium]|nr:T9SS type A sorting domain-containing protein [Bacteroidia bacterium]